MSGKNESFNKALMQAIIDKDAMEALKTFQVEFPQSQFTTISARNEKYSARLRREIGPDAYSGRAHELYQSTLSDTRGL